MRHREAADEITQSRDQHQRAERFGEISRLENQTTANHTREAEKNKPARQSVAVRGDATVP
jgi:hypothetical protein